MKKTLLTLCTVGLFNFANAQVSAYTFAGSTGTYTAISTGTSIATGTQDDSVISAKPIGFTFNYNGTNYTTFGASINGWISLGSTVPTNSYTPISTGTTNNIISALGKDLQLGYTAAGAYTSGSNTITMAAGATAGFVVGDVFITGSGFPAGTAVTAVGATTLTASANATTTGTAGTYTVLGNIQYLMAGTAPNRTCTIQWTRARRYGTLATTGQNNLFNFQIKLTETSNTISFVYGIFLTNATSSKYEVGLRGNASTDFNNRKTSTNWAATTAGTLKTDTCSLTTTVKPASGQTFTWTPPPVCSGPSTTPVASAPTGVCSGVSFDLVLTGYTPNVSGLTFQWQSSTTSGGTYTNIPLATTTTFATTQTATMYYKCEVTCSGGTAVPSNVVTVTLNAPSACYCIPTSSSCTSDMMTNVTISTINSTTTCSPAGYGTYTTPTATLNLGVNYPISISISSGFTEHASVWIDYNQNGTFDASEFTSIGSSTGTPITSSITIPGTATLGSTKMRVRLKYSTALTAADACLGYSFGETEDYAITIGAGTACSPPPTAGTASVSNDTVCGGESFNLILTGYTSGVTGITFQWQSSTTSGGTYTDISGATTSTYAATQTATMYYKCMVSCSGGTAVASTPIAVILKPLIQCYCISTATGVSDEEIFNVTVGTLNNTSTCTTTGGPGSVLKMYSNYTTVAAPLLSRTAANTFSVTIGTCGTTAYTSAFKIFIDYNQNGSFADAGEAVYKSDTATALTYTKTGSFTVPTSAASGNTLMRVVNTETDFAHTIDSCGTYGYGETEDYLVNIPSLVGIEENELLNTISVYPNPTTGLFNITTSNANFTQLTISVIDIQGKEVFNTSDKNYSVNYNKQINLEGLAKGIYYIKLNTGAGVKIQKLIIQ
ncbi:MAG: T9SS type A sorting domain-containing protein [Bacteroidetes bacterium]|nr:T9SS type A sorting domain-containing protein [Bacteroidota bacterium]